MKGNIFKSARLKLTLYYVGIMTIILIIFSGALIYTMDLKLKENLNGKIIIKGDREDPLDETSDDIQILIYYIDGSLLILIGFLSYFLAGKTLKPIKDSLDAQKKFSADASHDLRTPLAIITTESEVVLQNSSSKEKDYKKVIISNLEEARKMSKLVNDLLIISRSENESMPNNFVVVDLHNFVEKIIYKMKAQAENKGLSLNINEYKKILVKVNASNFERAFSNIIQNAINYTKVGSIKIDINSDEKKAYISVADTGVGISPQDLPYVFDRFYKAEHSRHDESGSGLGLCISKQIIEQHKGHIIIESKIGVGTTIKITIPNYDTKF